MEGAVAFYEVNKLYNRIKELEAENAELKKKLETNSAVSFGSPFMEEPLPEPTCIPRSAVWKQPKNLNWRVEGI